MMTIFGLFFDPAADNPPSANEETEIDFRKVRRVCSMATNVILI